MDARGSTYTIRPALIDDAPAVARLHVESWKTTYAGILPEELLGAVSVEKHAHLWQGHLAEPKPAYGIYLLQAAPRQGIRTLLVSHFVHELRVRGFTSMAVWALDVNPSKRFYEVLGGQLISQQSIERGG